MIELPVFEFKYEAVPNYPQSFHIGDKVMVKLSPITMANPNDNYPITQYQGKMGEVTGMVRKSYPDDEGMVEVLMGSGRRMSVLYSGLVKVGG